MLVLERVCDVYLITYCLFLCWFSLYWDFWEVYWWFEGKICDKCKWLLLWIGLNEKLSGSSFKCLKLCSCIGSISLFILVEFFITFGLKVTRGKRERRRRVEKEEEELVFVWNLIRFNFGQKESKYCYLYIFVEKWLLIPTQIFPLLNFFFFFFFAVISCSYTLLYQKWDLIQNSFDFRVSSLENS